MSGGPKPHREPTDIEPLARDQHRRGRETLAEHERRRRALRDSQLNQLRLGDPLYEHLTEIAHRYTGFNAVILASHNLDDELIRRKLHELAIYEARRFPSIPAFNRLLILARNERYAGTSNPDLSFFSEASEVIGPRFAPLLAYREIEQRIRFNPAQNYEDELSDIAGQFWRQQDLNGYYDTTRRLADYALRRGQFDHACGMLLDALKHLGTAGYVTNADVRRASVNTHSDQLAWIYRALSQIHISIARTEGTTRQATASLAQAERWNNLAMRAYRSVNEYHGIAQTLRERAEIEQLRDIDPTRRAARSTAAFLKSSRYFWLVGDRLLAEHSLHLAMQDNSLPQTSLAQDNIFEALSRLSGNTLNDLTISSNYIEYLLRFGYHEYMAAFDEEQITKRRLKGSRTVSSKTTVSPEHIRQRVEGLAAELGVGIAEIMAAMGAVSETAPPAGMAVESTKLPEEVVTQDKRPTWSDRPPEDQYLTRAEFLQKYYPEEVAANTPRPLWKEAKGKEGLPEFISRAYAAEILAGCLSKGDFYLDQDLYTDYYSWRRGKQPPEWHWLRDLPTKKQLEPTTEPEADLEALDRASRRLIRQYEAARKRAQRRARTPAPG